MNRGMRDGGGRPRAASGGDYGGGRGYGGDGGRRHPRGHGGPGLLDSGMMGGGGYGGGGYEMDSLLHQRSLQQQLSLRESQLALANSLLQQQQHQSFLMDGPGLGMRGPGALGPAPMGLGPGMMMNKRRQDMRPGEFGPDFKRPRNDFSPRPRDRYRGRDSDDGNRRSNYRRNQSSSAGRSTSGKPRGSSDKYDPEKPTDDEEKEGGSRGKGKGGDPFHCHVCNVNCRDNEGFQRHMNSMRHNDRMMGLLAVHEEKSVQIASRLKAEKHLRHLEDEDKVTRGFCKVCDMALKVRYADHQLMTFHKKRVKQVTKGCGWCGVPSFKNFSEVLAHRDTEEHQKNQKEHEKDEPRKGKDSERGGSRSATKKRAAIRVEIPADLARYNSDLTYGQMCVIPVSGWFCKLCNKFYNNEAAAKEAHCKTEQHYVKYKRFVYAKLKAKAEAEREAEEKAEEEEGKKMEEEEGSEGHENGREEEEEKDESFEAEQEEEEMMEEGGAGEEEEEEDAMLATDRSAGDYLDEEDIEGSLLEDTREASSYLTAEDTTGAGEQEEEEEASTFSITAGESGSEFLTSEQTDELAMLEDSQEENLEGEGEGDLSQEGEEEEEEVTPRATRASVNPRNTSTPARGKAGTNKARRGRKMAK